MSEPFAVQLLAVDLSLLPAEALSALTFDGPTTRDVLSRVHAADPNAEVMVVARPDRFELYAEDAGHKAAFRIVLAEVVRRVGLVAELSAAPAWEASGVVAVRHLLRAAAGWGRGGTILERVAAMKRGVAAASHAGTLGPVLAELFETAIRVAWRAQSETDLGRPASGSESELEELEVDRIVEEELVAYRAQMARRSSVPASGGASRYPSIEPASMVRSREPTPSVGLSGKAVA